MVGGRRKLNEKQMKADMDTFKKLESSRAMVAYVKKAVPLLNKRLSSTAEELALETADHLAKQDGPENKGKAATAYALLGRVEHTLEILDALIETDKVEGYLHAELTIGFTHPLLPVGTILEMADRIKNTSSDKTTTARLWTAARLYAFSYSYTNSDRGRLEIRENLRDIAVRSLQTVGGTDPNDTIAFFVTSNLVNDFELFRLARKGKFAKSDEMAYNRLLWAMTALNSNDRYPIIAAEASMLGQPHLAKHAYLQALAKVDNADPAQSRLYREMMLGLVEVHFQIGAVEDGLRILREDLSKMAREQAAQG